jgi:CRP/FNR family transcriptional regulator, cyclic AMP receptor protein
MDSVDPATLKGVTIFSTLVPDQLVRVARSGEVVEHPAGDTLTEEGSHGHRFLLILEGSAEVERGGHTIDTLGRGDFVGEIGLLGGGPSTATVRCTSPTTLLTIWRERFWELLEAEPAIALRILEVLCRRIERDRAANPVGNFIFD